MAVDQKIRCALDLKSLSFPPSIPVLAIDVEDYTDWTGDPALRVSVTVDESVDEESISGEDVGNLKDSIYKSLRDHGITLFPYIFLAKPSELVETGEE
jgi:hypothetical protein